MRMLVDFHHSSLLRSLVMLFEERLGIQVYRPIGMEWYRQDYWSINDSPETAKQFLSPESQPLDGTPQLNEFKAGMSSGVLVWDPGRVTYHRAITFEEFMDLDFDYVLSSIPEHEGTFDRLAEEHHSHPTRISHIGNYWMLEKYRGSNIMASAKLHPAMISAARQHVVYRQEFDVDLFTPRMIEVITPQRLPMINTYVNVLGEKMQATRDFQSLRAAAGPHFGLRSYGGQCEDGNLDGAESLGYHMRNAFAILHSKDGGDGYGHIIHNAICTGRPVIARMSQYRSTLVETLLREVIFADLDTWDPQDVITRLRKFWGDLPLYQSHLLNQVRIFQEYVNFADEAEAVKEFLARI